MSGPDAMGTYRHAIGHRTKGRVNAMMSLATIQAMARENAERAAREGKAPFVYASGAEVEGSFPFPFLGDYVPPGWTLVNTYFVDSSGFGRDDEPALTADQFRRVVNDKRAEHGARRETVGWAITEAGQFQVYVGEYVRPVGSE